MPSPSASAPHGDPFWFADAALQRKVDVERDDAAARVDPRPTGAGAALGGEVRQRMETALGADFSSVRVHESAKAPALGAHAYTHGDDVVFAPGAYDPTSARGQELLGHELGHVVQQRRGAVQATTRAAGAAVNDDAGLEAEADRAGARAAALPAGAVARNDDADASRTAAHADAPVQRTVTIDGEEGDDDYESIEQAVATIMLGAPAVVQQAYARIRDSEDVELIIRFDPGVVGYGHTVTQGQRIWITLSDSLLPQDDEENLDGDEQQFQNVDHETELQATLIHELVLHVMPALDTIFEGEEEWESDEDTEHGVLGGWQTVLVTAAAVNPTVLRNSIVDTLVHLHHLGDDFTTLCHNIQYIGDQHGVTLDWRVIGGVPYEVRVGSDEGEIRLVRQDGKLVEADDDEDPFAHGHDFVPLQMKVDFERDEDLGNEDYAELMTFVQLFVLAHPMLPDLLYGNDVDVLFRFEPQGDQDACGTTKVLVEGETSDLVSEAIDLMKAGSKPTIRIIVREGDDMHATLLHELTVHALPLFRALQAAIDANWDENSELNATMAMGVTDDHVLPEAWWRLLDAAMACVVAAPTQLQGAPPLTIQQFQNQLMGDVLEDICDHADDWWTGHEDDLAARHLRDRVRALALQFGAVIAALPDAPPVQHGMQIGPQIGPQMGPQIGPQIGPQMNAPPQLPPQMPGFVYGGRMVRNEDDTGFKSPYQFKRDGAARAAHGDYDGGNGLPTGLRSGLEQMSGFDLGGVTVQRNSSEPARMNARAFARGTEIHLGPGNDGDLAHEAWHVVQQMQGRVAATTQHAGSAINDDAGLESEADEMGARAVAAPRSTPVELHTSALPSAGATSQLRGVTMPIVQEAIGLGFRRTSENSNPQQTSDDLAFNNAIVCHYSVSEADPGRIHISFYPSNDEEYKAKILHYAYRWDVDTERFVGAGQLLATWKPFASVFAQLKPFADGLMEGLRGRIVTILDRPPVVQQPTQYKRDPGAVAPVVQRIVYDEDDNQDCDDADDVFDLISERIRTDDRDAVIERIKALMIKNPERYSTTQVIDDLVSRGLAERVEEMEEDVQPDDRNLHDGTGRKLIGGKHYTPAPRGFHRTGDALTWRVKDNPFQRGNAENEFLGGLLYAALVGQHGAAELHYHGDNPYGLIVKQDLPDFRIWAGAMDDFSGGNYDAQGLGRIAVAAWFLGEHDMHTANFGTVDTSDTPQLGVVDPSGALHPDNLERPLHMRDLAQLPLPPEEWTHSEGGWQLHDRSVGATPETRVNGLSQPVQQRIPREKSETLQRIAQLDLRTITIAIVQRCFLDGVALVNVPQERRATLPVLTQWAELFVTLEGRRQQVLDMLLELLGRAIDQRIQNRPPPPQLTSEQETKKFWGIK